MHDARMRRTGTYDKVPRGRYVAVHGYVCVKKVGHPVARQTGWAYEHRIVLYDAIGVGPHPCHWCGAQVRFDRTYPQHQDGLVVDHLNDDKADNRPANLVPSCNPCNSTRSTLDHGEAPDANTERRRQRNRKSAYALTYGR